MRIAFLNSWPEARHQGSGTAVSIANLARGLTVRGHQVVLLSPERVRSADRPLPLLVQRLRFNRSIARRIHDSGPLDLVVGFDLDGFLWATRDRERAGHNGRPSPPFALWLKGVAADEARFARGPDSLLLSFVARLESMNARAADRVLVPSRYSAGIASSSYGLPPRVLRVVPEAIDLEEWSLPEDNGRGLNGSKADRSATLPSPAAPLEILSVARQYQRKDTATLLRALPVLERAGVPARLRVIGGGPELARLEKLARGLDLSRPVQFLGPVEDSARVRAAYRDAHLFCLPSLQEGFGLVFLEAMASGLPIVAARAGATPEVVGSGAGGRLFAPGDHEELGHALVELARNPELRERMTEAGYRRVRTFSLSHLADRFVEASL